MTLWAKLKCVRTFCTLPVLYDMAAALVSLPLALALRLGEGIWEAEWALLSWNSLSFTGICVGVFAWTQRYKNNWEDPSLIDFLGAYATAFFCLLLFIPYIAFSGQFFDLSPTLLVIQFLVLTNLWWVGRLVYCLRSNFGL